MLKLCCFLLLLAGCRWHGIRPVYEQVKLEEQARLAMAVVFAEPVGSRSLHHQETIPTSQFRGPGTEYVQWEAVEKVLKVRQVLKGPVEAGSLLKIDTYEVKIKGIPGMPSQPAIFFLTRDGDVWTPFTDFGPNSIVLPDFPNRPLTISRIDSGPTSWIALDRALIHALLDPRNASDWPTFKVVLDRLVRVAVDLASASGSEPELITDSLTGLLKTGNPAVAAAARKEILSRTALCNETGPIALESGPELTRKQFMAGQLYSPPGSSPEERERTYWRLKAYSCSKLPQIRAKAEVLLHRYFPNRQTVGCEICSGGT